MDNITRRNFLTKSTTMAGWFTLSSCATIPIYPTIIKDGQISVNFEKFPSLKKPGEGILLTSPSLHEPVLLINLDGKTFRAFSGICTHLGCNLRPSGNFIQCPCHGSTYNLEGQVTRGPAQRPLKIFKTKIFNGKVDVVISESRRL